MYAVYTVYTVYTAYTVYAVCTVHTVYTVYAVYTVYIMISYCHNIVITWTKIQPFCTLRTPFDIVLTLFSTMGITRCNVCTKTYIYMFYKYAHTSGSKGSPDMILNAYLPGSVHLHIFCSGLPLSRVKGASTLQMGGCAPPPPHARNLTQIPKNI